MQGKTQNERDKERVRDINFHLRMSKSEHDQLLENLKKSGYQSLNDYLIDMGLHGYIVMPSYSFTKPVSDCAYELSKIGTNINQIAHRVNATDVFNSHDFALLKTYLESCRSYIRTAFRYFLE